MNHEKHEKTRKKKLTTENTEVSFEGLVGLFEQTQAAMQRQAAKSADIALVVRNWLFGWYIVEFENGGAERAELYGKKLFKRLSEVLNRSGLKGMSETNLRKFREFYQGYAEIQQTLPAQSFFSASISETLSRKSGEGSFLPDDFWQTLSGQFSLSWSLRELKRNEQWRIENG